jgi:hypothetical protein
MADPVAADTVVPESKTITTDTLAAKPAADNGDGKPVLSSAVAAVVIPTVAPVAAAAPPAAPEKGWEKWAQAKQKALGPVQWGVHGWRAAAAAVVQGWGIGAEVTEAEFEAAWKSVGDLKIGR